jgi:hypothetical protein
MKYVSYLIFFAFVALLLTFLKNALEPDEEPVAITGSEKCGECHGLKVNGSQMEKWKSSRHSAAYVSLTGSKAKDFASANNLGNPEQNEKCLKCHTTEFRLSGTIKNPSYNIHEGVGCESCHGAGSLYSPAYIMKNESAFLQFGGIKGDERTCLKCHNPKGSGEQKLSDDRCPFQKNDFDYKTAFEKIRHPGTSNNK